ncbi:pimeloyl-ACP methyl ester carboxylesterase [Mucilaginibacter oryzae]|uniref:Pimeloyl-ACP methyl ester carboxylesterase n=1 Tax=Mucilaginibacter oryzae TaxID=468058 RepID=A0A316HE77_9SPHI|nr:alpha/beta hydrolase [Mucilaginibacter oryzae]PWK76605.1 pimeloyl-ACP methyl ester carboxylesterase [Mucilaginibacter oryzae]
MNQQVFNYVAVPTQYVEVEGIRYAYRSLGKPGKVPVVCLQHFTGTLDNWDPVIVDGLATERPVILIDNTGVGNSGGQTPDNVLDMSRDAIKVISALGIQKCDLLGFSLGGFLAQAMTSLKPELFRKLIIVGAAPQGAKALHSFPQLVEKAFALPPKEQYLFVFATKSENSRAKIAATLERLYIRTDDRDQSATMDAIKAQISALTRWGTDPVTIDLSKITQPVLIVQGSDDEMMDSAASLDMYKKLPHAVLIYYPDAAHGSFNQYPELFVEQANSFLNKFD